MYRDELMLCVNVFMYFRLIVQKKKMLRKTQSVKLQSRKAKILLSRASYGLVFFLFFFGTALKNRHIAKNVTNVYRPCGGPYGAFKGFPGPPCLCPNGSLTRFVRPDK